MVKYYVVYDFSGLVFIVLYVDGNESWFDEKRFKYINDHKIYMRNINPSSDNPKYEFNCSNLIVT